MARLLLLFSLFHPAWPAFRAYMLKIEWFDAKLNQRKTEWVTTTLDPVQYEKYHASAPGSQITLYDTWYCPGDTGRYRKVCPRPIEKKPVSKDEFPYTRQPIVR